MPDVKSFSVAKDKPRRRSRFDIPYEFIGTANEGALVPFYMGEVIAGDTFDIKETHTIRYLQTPARPTMQPAYIDTFFAYVPFRLLWKYWDKFFGVAEASDYDVDTNYVLPSFDLVSGEASVQVGSVANCLKIPAGYSGNINNPLPLMAYLKVWSDHFRDQQTQNTPPLLEVYYNAPSGTAISIDDYDEIGEIVGSVAGDVPHTSVCKYHDYYTSSMINTQRGTMTQFSLAGFAPVIAKNEGSGTSTGNYLGLSGGLIAGYSTDDFYSGNATAIDPTTDIKLYANMEGLTALNIEDLRVAIATQRYKENLLRFGSGNYHDLLRGMYGIAPHDETLQRSEILGGSHQMLNMQQVATTAGSGSVGTATNTSTGQLGAYSVTSGGNRSVIKTFKEPGLVLGLAAVRVKHSYSQGLAKIYNKVSRFDYYNGLFDALGFQPIKEIEIYAGDGTSTNTFAFQEAWSEYRFDPSWIAGSVTPGVATDLTAWTYGDNYNEAPVRNSEWIVEDKGRLQQTLAGTASVPQLIFNFHIVNAATRPMSLFSQPSSLGM